MNWEDLKFWQSGEWDVIQEKLDDLDAAGKLYNPPRHLLFAALDACPFDHTRVCIIGQDPYPDRSYCTGFAFSIPKSARTIPPSLAVILEEYCNDLHYPMPSSGNLDRWTRQGVLLWNAVPSCLTGQSLSHNFPEWEYLSQEIVRSLSPEGVVFVFVGSVAKRLMGLVDTTTSKVLQVAHPAAEKYGRNARIKDKFTGSRIFSTINDKLCELGRKPIDWKLT